MRVFLSYPHEHRRAAEAIRLALEEGGHDVFFDRANLEPGESYVVAIREQIERSDLFVFLLSPDSLQAGRFTLTELGLAEKKWRRPHQHVLPVLIAPVPGELLPPLLTAVGILEARGDVPAEVANQVEVLARRRRDRRRARTIAFGLAALGVLAVCGLLSGAWSRGWVPRVIDSLRATSSRLPADTSAGAFSGGWTVVPSGTAVDLPSQFIFQTEGAELSGIVFHGGRPMRILDGKAGESKVTFRVKRSYAHDGETVEETDRYQGELAGREIDFLRTVERRDVVVAATRFVARRPAAAGPPAAGSDRAPGTRCSFGDELGRLELRDEDVSRQATVYLICRLRNREGLFVGEEGLAIQEEPFGQHVFFSAQSMAKIATDLQRRTWACGGYDDSQGGVVRSDGAPAPGRAGPRYVFCQTQGRPTSLELRVASRKADGSIGPERRVIVKFSE